MAFMEIISVARTGLRNAALPVVLVVAAGSASAANISIFNTGVDAMGAVVSDNTIGDLHYTLDVVPSGPTEIQSRTSARGFPIGPWIGDNSLSSWIGPNSDDSLNGPIGTYVYSTTFDLTGLKASTAQLSGRWATDNPGLDILLNGASTGNAAPGQFTTWSPFSITSGFVTGVNKLEFVLRNDGGPTGLRVEISGTATPIPVPAALPLLAAALGGLGFVGRRRQKS